MALLLTTLAGCGQTGTISFEIKAPTGRDDDRLSPFTDGRRETVVVYDETGGGPLGTPISTKSMSGLPLDVGLINVGHYDVVRLDVTGGGQLLGLARTRGVDVVPETASTVTLQARKPIAFFGAAQAPFSPVKLQLPLPDPLMLIDTTLPPIAVLPPVKLAEAAVVTASTRDGLYVLAAGAGGNVFALATSAIYSTPPARAGIQSIPGSTRPPQPRSIVVSPDDDWAVIVSDQGLSLFKPEALAATQLNGVPTTKLAGATAAAFSPDGRTLAVLAGPTWSTLDCRNPTATPAQFYRFTVDPTTGNLQLTTGPDKAPVSATDVAYDKSGTLLFAVPCSGAANTTGIMRVDGSMIVTAPGIYDVVVAGDRLIGVENVITTITSQADTDDSGVRGELLVVPSAGGTPAPAAFEIPADRINLGDSSVQLRPHPAQNSLVAYRAVATPGGTDLLFAYRIRYELNDVPYITAHYQMGGKDGPLAFECRATVVRDVYRTTQVDVTTGRIGYQATRGVHDVVPCALSCKTCSLIGGCMPQAPSAGTQCAIDEGFIPEGLTVMMGER